MGEKMVPRIAILGAGISGLALGWFLKQKLGSKIQIAIFEKNSRAGGWIHTQEVDGFLFEQGPRSCRTKGVGRETLALVEKLGLQSQVIIPHASAQSRFIYDGYQLRSLPKNIWGIPFHSLTRDFLKVIFRDLYMPKCKTDDESIYSFFHRRLGCQWTEYLIDPFVSGIYAGDCKRLSLKSCFPLFDEWEKHHGSLLRGAWSHREVKVQSSPFVDQMSRSPMFSFLNGMETLPLSLASELKEDLFFECAVNKISFQEEEVTVEFENRKNWIGTHVVSTLPIFSLRDVLPSHLSLRQLLSRLSYASLVVVNIGFKKIFPKLNGFGYLIPSKLGIPILGGVWDSSIFPQQNKGDQTRVTMILGGSLYPEVVEMSEGGLIKEVTKGLQDQMGIFENPDLIQITKVHHAIPQFEVGYTHWKTEVETLTHSLYPRLTMSGSAWSGVSINDCISHANCLSEKIVNQVSQVSFTENAT